jgi:hypothetical protein
MKKLFVSAGLATIGIMTLHASDYAPDITAMDATKLWSVSGTLRGFYDDNYNTAPANNGKRASSGFEFSPSFSLIMPLQQTELGLRYTYGLYYYQDRENLGQNPIDQSHEADLWIDHAFSERWEGKIQDVFVDAQNPQLSATPTSLPYRVNGNNYDNVGTVTVHTEWSMLFNTDLGYQNTFLWYEEHGATTASIAGGKPPTNGGLLDQLNHSIWLNLNYQYLHNLSFLVGYQFGLNNYTGDEPIAQNYKGGFPVAGQFYYSKNRDSYSQYGYVGAQYAATANLTMSVQAGVQYSDNDNLPSFNNQSQDQLEPYANVAATYTYLPGSYAQVGFSQSESSAATADVSGNGSLTLYQESSVIYASINHQITPNLLASVIGHYQYSTFQGGANDGEAQDWYSAGFNLSYAFNPYLSAEIGYNYDYLTSTGPLGGYARNREYIGVTGSF